MARTVEWVEVFGRLINKSDYSVRIKPFDSGPVHFGVFNRIEIHHAVSIERRGVHGHLVKSPYELGALTVDDAGDGILIISFPM